MAARTPTIQDLRLVVDYLRALRNEAAVDEHALAMSGIKPASLGKIPRPSRWISRARCFPIVSRFLQRACLPIWYLLGPMLFASQRRKLGARPATAPVVGFDPSGQILGFSSRALDIVHAGHIDPLPQQWIELPWLELGNLLPGAKVTRALDLLDEADLQRAFALASLSHRLLQRRHELRGWGLQTYTAFHWFVARIAIDKLPGPLLTVEHFDRWAILVDGSAWASRLRDPTRRLTLMQHGSVNAETAARSLSIKLPSRLRGVKHLHVYSATDEAIFRRDILSPLCNQRGVEASYFRPLIALTDLAKPDRPALLFVGHPLCESAHRALMLALQSHGDFQAFYKPHPTTGAGRQIPSLPWTIIEGRTVFPKVDLIVSYPSTMVLEYAARGIPAVVHQMDIPVDEVHRLIPEIVQRFSQPRSAPTADGTVRIS